MCVNGTSVNVGAVPVPRKTMPGSEATLSGTPPLPPPIDDQLQHRSTPLADNLIDVVFETVSGTKVMGQLVGGVSTNPPEIPGTTQGTLCTRGQRSDWVPLTTDLMWAATSETHPLDVFSC